MICEFSGNNTFKLPNSDGSAGQFMKTDGSGNLSFDTAGGGGKVLNYKQYQAVGTHSTTSTSYGVISSNFGIISIPFLPSKNAVYSV